MSLHEDQPVELEGAIDDLRKMIRERDVVLGSISFVLSEIGAAVGLDDAARDRISADFARLKESLGKVSG